MTGRSALMVVIVLALVVGSLTVAPRPALAASTLGPGETLPAGGWLVSPNGAYRLTPQTDGNLVLYGPRGAVWWTGVARGPARLTMQGDGNLVLYGAVNALWTSYTWGVAPGATSLSVTDDGNLLLSAPSVGSIWNLTSGRLHHYMWSGYAMPAGQSRVSVNTAFRMHMQGDGNLVIYGPAGPVWWSRTGGTGADTLILQGDGNLVIYRRGVAVWHSGTFMFPGAELLLQDDGNAVLIHNGRAVWSALTGPLVRRASAAPLDASTRTALQSNGTWNPGCPVTLDDLVALTFPYTDRAGARRWGVMYINRDAVAAVGQATEDMDYHRFPIWEYGGFRCEMMSSGRWSEHAYGRSVDFNWTVNPYTNGTTIIPAGSGAYLDRSRNEPGMFYANSVGVQTFARHGWGWGGSWTYQNGVLKDYMHFSWNNR